MDPHEVALKDSEEDLLSAAASVAQALASWFSATGEQITAESIKGVMAANGAEASAAAAEAVFRESETQMAGVKEAAELAVVNVGKEAAAAEIRFAAARSAIDSEDSRFAFPLYKVTKICLT